MADLVKNRGGGGGGGTNFQSDCLCCVLHNTYVRTYCERTNPVAGNVGTYKLYSLSLSSSRVSLEDLYTGKQMSVEYPRKILCPKCNGYVG